MANSDFRPVYHPAYHDNELRTALQDLRTGRWLSMRDLLESTPDWTLWTQRTQVLGAVAAGSDAVQAWLTEEPRSVAATVMHARVAVERAVRARRSDHPSGQELWQEAWEACRSAAHASPADPVPWVCLLALSQLDQRQRLEEHRLHPLGPCSSPGRGACWRRRTSAIRTTARPTTACCSSSMRAEWRLSLRGGQLRPVGGVLGTRRIGAPCAAAVRAGGALPP